VRREEEAMTSQPEHDAPHALSEGREALREVPPSSSDPLRDRLLERMPEHVVFDGWSQAAIDASAREAGVDPEAARQAFPRGGVDAALAWSALQDRRMAEALAEEPLAGMGMTARVTRAVRLRLELVEPHREAVRRAANLFALPIYAADGAAMVWRSADAIWRALGDESEDANWYTKRASLSGVVSATVLYWLQDDSEARHQTWRFLDRRIADVMRIEKAKARVQRNPLGRAFISGADRLARGVRAPRRHGRGSAVYDGG
jgi:ubiquinone biosynthesis protein COQ9